MGAGSTLGPCLEDPLHGHTADWVHSLSKVAQSLGYGRMVTEGMLVGPGGLRGNDWTRAAWGDQQVPTDLVWSREEEEIMNLTIEVLFGHYKCKNYCYDALQKTLPFTCAAGLQGSRKFPINVQKG